MTQILEYDSDNQLNEHIKSMRKKGFEVVSIKSKVIHEVRFEIYSQKINKTTKVPILIYLGVPMLKLICGKLGIKKYTNLTKSELIFEIEKYKTSEVMKYYNQISK